MVNRKNNISRKSILLLGVALVLGVALPSHITVSISASLDHRIFWLSKAPLSGNVLQKDDYVLFDHDSPWKGRAPSVPFLKKITCWPGDRLLTIGGEFFCEGVSLGEALQKDSKGNLLENFKFNGTVPPGQLFVSGSHKRSYDSRYFGFINASAVKVKAIPLF